MLPRSSQLGSAWLTRLVRVGLLVGLIQFVAVCLEISFWQTDAPRVPSPRPVTLGTSTAK
jgi:hypothetical protein